LDHSRFAGLGVDLGEMATRKGNVIDLTRWRRRDTVWSSAFRSMKDLQLACCGVQPAINSVLAREPVDSFRIERAGIEIGVAGFGWQLPDRHFPAFRVVADDCILAAIRNPGRAVRPLDNPMRRGAFAERNMLHFS